MARFIVQVWVCEYGIYDTFLNKFIGIPMSYNESFIVLQWLNNAFDSQEIKIIKQK